MPAGSNGTMEVKTQACFSISIIVVGFISGVHYCLIGLIRKRHDCITNSTRACQDGFISIPVPFLEKHLVISVWWNYCAQPFIDLRCKTSRLPICNNKPPSAAQPLQAQQRSRCKNDFCSFWVELSEAEIKQERENVWVYYLHLSTCVCFLCNHVLEKRSDFSSLYIQSTEHIRAKQFYSATGEGRQ